MIPREIVQPLLGWFYENRRDLPWRKEPSAYHVWLSEIMLQQTRVEAVKGYYHRFLEALPEIEDLAACPETRLLKLWEGLGYYNRVRNMQKAARVVVEHYGGALPPDYEKLLGLPGIGSYTAGAVASIAFGISRPAVDGNVLRVIARITENEEDILRQSVKTKTERELAEIMPKDAPGDLNQSLMELGALICIPNGMAKCGECPLAELCLARKHDRVMELPKKAEKKQRRLEKRTVLLIQDGEDFAIRKREKKGLLAGMYEFPNLEGYKSQEEVLEYVRGLSCQPVRIQPLSQAKHIFSHVEWEMEGYRVLIEPRDKRNADGLLFVNKRETKGKYPIPAAFAAYRKYLEEDI